MAQPGGSETIERRARVRLEVFRVRILLIVHRITDQRNRTTNLHPPALLHRRRDERPEQRMRLERPRFQLRVELYADKPGVISGSSPLGASGARTGFVEYRTRSTPMKFCRRMANSAHVCYCEPADLDDPLFGALR